MPGRYSNRREGYRVPRGWVGAVAGGSGMGGNPTRARFRRGGLALRSSRYKVRRTNNNLTKKDLPGFCTTCEGVFTFEDFLFRYLYFVDVQKFQLLAMSLEI